MSGVYKSLKVVVQDSLKRRKTNSVPLARVNSNSALSLNDEMEQLERILVARIGRLRAAIKEGEAVVANETQDADQLVESLKVSIAVLEAKLIETEETVRRKDFSRQQLEESLTAKIHDLQNDLKKKEEALESRENEVSDLKANVDGQVKLVAELEMAVQKARLETASHAKRAEHLTESSKATITALEAYLRDTEDLVRKKDSTIKGLEQSLIARIQDFESQVRNKEELLAAREAEINDLKSQLKLLTKGIEEMSSFFRQTEVLAAIEGQDVSTALVVNEPSDGAEEETATFESDHPKVTSSVADAAPEIVSADLFQRITGELTELTGVMRPIASVIVRDHVLALGESMEKFPKARLPELLETLSKEMLDENLKTDFRNWLAQNAQIGGERTLEA